MKYSEQEYPLQKINFLICESVANLITRNFIESIIT